MADGTDTHKLGESIDALRRQFVEHGLSSEHAAIAAGLAADYAEAAYRQGHTRGFDQGWSRGEARGRELGGAGRG